MASVCMLVATSCSSHTGDTTAEAVSISDVDPSAGAYDLALTSSGGEPRLVLFRPAPVGLSASYTVALRHEDPQGRHQTVRAGLEIVVLVSAADGSATQLQATLADVTAATNGSPDDALQRDLNQLSGQSFTWWIDESRIATNVEHNVTLGDFGFASAGFVAELLDAPIALSRPLPTGPVGTDATWNGTLRSADGTELAYSAIVLAMNSAGYKIEVTTATAGTDGRVTVTGVPGDPFPVERHLGITDETGGVAELSLIATTD